MAPINWTISGMNYYLTHNARLAIGSTQKSEFLSLYQCRYVESRRFFYCLSLMKWCRPKAAAAHAAYHPAVPLATRGFTTP
jgi:hypothetical protein